MIYGGELWPEEPLLSVVVPLFGSETMKTLKRQTDMSPYSAGPGVTRARPHVPLPQAVETRDMCQQPPSHLVFGMGEEGGLFSRPWSKKNGRIIIIKKKHLQQIFKFCFFVGKVHPRHHVRYDWRLIHQAALEPFDGSKNNPNTNTLEHDSTSLNLGNIQSNTVTGANTNEHFYIWLRCLLSPSW